MPVLAVRHATTYRYRQAVGLGEHRLMVRPRDGHDQGLLAFALDVSPAPAETRWAYDPFGNPVATLRFGGARARELRIVARLRVDHRPAGPPDGRIAPHARAWPFSYDADETPDLVRCVERRHRDPQRAVDGWARRFVREGGPTDTAGMLADMTEAVRRDFTYLVREERGVQEPRDTLRLGSGTCRDFALLFMEAARSLGLAARFVSGYLHHPRGRARVGGGATHAWAQVYLPGAGWTDYDPTNAIADGRDLVRVAAVRDPAQAVPVAGSFTGFAGDALGMDVEVSVEDESEAGAAAGPAATGTDGGGG